MADCRPALCTIHQFSPVRKHRIDSHGQVRGWASLAIGESFSCFRSPSLSVLDKNRKLIRHNGRPAVVKNGISFGDTVIRVITPPKVQKSGGPNTYFKGVSDGKIERQREKRKKETQKEIAVKILSERRGWDHPAPAILFLAHTVLYLTI